MLLGPLPPTHRSRLPLGLAALTLTLLVAIPAISESPASPSADTLGWAVGRPLAIAIGKNSAHFTLPTPSHGSRTLVIVSSMSRASATLPIHFVANPIDPGLVTPPSNEPCKPRQEPFLSPPALDRVKPPVSRKPAPERTFHLMVREGDVASSSNYLAVKGTLRAFGQRVQIYVDDNDLAEVGREVLSDIVSTFDNQVFPLSARTFGQARDIDGDGRFTVFMSTWLTRLAGGRHAVDGFVRNADLDATIASPFSNQCDMMYLSTSLKSGGHLRTVLAHEYTHAVTFSAKMRANPALPLSDEEGWLDEALAHLVEDLHGFSRTNINYRVSAFLSRPECYRLVVKDYYTADLFRSHGNRGGAYLFLRWCADKFGPALLPALIQSPRHGIANLEAATGIPFADLYRAWSVSLFTSGFDPSSMNEPAFRSLDVRGTLEGWVLAGPRAASVRPGDPALEWYSAGTASRFVIVEPASAGAVEITINAPPEAELQVTVVPLPDDLARIDLNIRRDPGADRKPAFWAEIRERNGTSVSLTALAWEPMVPGPNPHAAAFRHAGLDSLGIAASFGASELPALGRLRSKPIAAEGAFEPESGPFVVKAVGTDSHGRRVSAWAEVSTIEASSLPGQPGISNSN